MTNLLKINLLITNNTIPKSPSWIRRGEVPKTAVVFLATFRSKLDEAKSSGLSIAKR